MKLKNIVAGGLSFVAAFATAQTLTFNGSASVGDTFEGIWLSNTPYVGSPIELLSPLSPAINAFSATFTTATTPALTNPLPIYTSPTSTLIDPAYNYSFLLVKVGNTNNDTTAGFSATLTLGGPYQFLNGSNTLTTGGSDVSFWRGLNALSNPTLTNQGSFASIIDSAIASTGLSLFTGSFANSLWTSSPATTVLNPDEVNVFTQDSIFATVIRATRS